MPLRSPGSGSAATDSGQSLAVKTPLGSNSSASQLPKQRQGVVPGQVLLTLDANTSVTGGALTGNRMAARAPQTNNAALNKALHAAGATSLLPALPSLPQASASSPATSQLRSSVSGVPRAYVVHMKDQDSAAVARTLEGTSGVAFAEPNRYVNTMNTGAQPLSSSAVRAAAVAAAAAAKTPSASTGAIPTNYDLAYSAQSLLNAGGVNAVGAFPTLKRKFGQMPGAGEIITNVSLGDLIDESMANDSDHYAQGAGATTVLRNGQRYLDLPSMPLIPTYVADENGSLSGTATVENEDASLGEVMLDFGVMAPLPHDRQRPGRTGSGYTDLLGIAPGAKYRLVVPQRPTTDQIAGALLAAANQSPRPNVITASLGVGTDAVGFPGRYFEDDPVIHNVVEYIVHQYGIVVSISSNDGTRMYTRAAVGPDGGSTPTDTARDAAEATSIDDDAMSTTPTKVLDSGAIAAGGTTLDDTLAAPAGRSTNGTVAETRISGFGVFSSGFGSRVDLSAPSDNIIAFEHPVATLGTPAGGPSDVNVVLSGGTSASAPEIAAAAAVVLQASRLAGHHLTPAQVRTLLESTARPVSSPAQIDRPLHVGPQIDVTAATEKALGSKSGSSAGPAIVRLAVAHRVTFGALGGRFTEGTYQNRIDLGDMASGRNGEGLVGPVTFAGDVTGVPSGAGAQYTLTVGSTVWRSNHPAIRVTPKQLLAAAHLPVVSTRDRTIQLDYRVLLHGRVRAGVHRTLTIGPSDGRYLEATAPGAPAVVSAGQAVTVHYDLTGVTKLSNPQLVLSTVGHWNPLLAPTFTAAWHQDLKATTGTVTIPASAFDGGGGIYGIGISQITNNPSLPSLNTYGEFAPIRIKGSSAADRPAAPLLTGASGPAGHNSEVNRAKPAFSLGYDVRGVPGAASAQVELSAPAPALSGFNTFTNANGTKLDDDGVDTPSAAHHKLPATSGTVRLDALKLGLKTSEFYNVRVLALDSRGRVLGQASPTSMLQVDDGLAPDDSTVTSFAIAGADSLAALRMPAGGSVVRHYDPTTGTYGTLLTSDAPNSVYGVLGVIPATHNALLVHQEDAFDGGGVSLETWNTATDTLVGDVTVPTGYTFVTGKVDPARNRAAVLLRGSTEGASALLPIDLSTGTGASLIPLPDAAGLFPWQLIDIDSTTGDVSLMSTRTAGGCTGNADVPRVDLGTGTVTSAGSASRCTQELASDSAGTLYGLTARSANRAFAPTSILTTVVGDDQTSRQIPIRTGAANSLAIDSTNQLAVAGFDLPAGIPNGHQQGWIADNNATSQMQVTDLTTGQPVRTLSGFSQAAAASSDLLQYMPRQLQLDPATRTGWIFGAYDAQIQQFSY
ncbi:S8 family serine peptidase [Streptomyces mirabilis]|uniref:S8 family serine peptidase n=1 Tax=Streptomyces mirabilis TaxID=68239 RepID=UPI0036AA2F39